MDVPTHPDCRVALLTPSGRGAIATVSVTGSQATQFVQRFFVPRGRYRFIDAPLRRILVGHWRDTRGGSEEVVVARSSTHHVEIHCHGGLAASEALISSLREAGASITTSEDWLRSQVANPVQRSAWWALSHAPTERVAGILLDQWRGALAQAMEEILRWLSLEPPQLEPAAARIRRLVDLSDLGSHLISPWRVVLTGAPNVGKSSLVNGLLGFERCIVFDQPGTTRDVLSATTVLDGWPIEISDTAGDRESSDRIEVEGTRRAWQQLQHADLAVIVVDVSRTSDHDVGRFQQAVRNSLVVANKIDLSPAESRLPAGWLATSALTGHGMCDLAEAIVRHLVPLPPSPGEAVPFTREYQSLVRDLKTLVDTGDLERARCLLRTWWTQDAHGHSRDGNYLDTHSTGCGSI